MSLRKVFLIALCTFMCLHGVAYAGPPYETDDPDPTDYRNYEIYLFGDYHRILENIESSPATLEFNYGCLPNTQCSFDIPTVQSSQTTGLGDIDIGLKYRFVPETAGRPQISFYPSVTIATGNVEQGLGEGHGTLFLPLWAQKSWGKWTIFGGGGLQLDHEVGGYASWHEGVAITRDVGTTNIGVEVYRQTNAGLALPGYTDVGLGLISNIGEYHAWLLSVGRAFAPDSMHIYGAYEWRLGPASTKTDEP
jgi:hypothetical protein